MLFSEEEVNTWFEPLENPDNSFQTNCNGCLFAIQEVSKLHVLVESKFHYIQNEISQLQQNYTKQQNEIIELKKENVLLKQDKYIFQTNLLIGDVISTIYDKISKKLRTHINVRIYEFFDDLYDTDSPNYKQYNEIFQNVLGKIGITREEYDDLHEMNSVCHGKSKNAKSILEEMMKRKMTEKQEKIKTILLKCLIS
jgi:hypothetical protein